MSWLPDPLGFPSPRPADRLALGFGLEWLVAGALLVVGVGGVLGLAIGCAGGSLSRTPVQLASIADAVDHPKAKELAFTGNAVTEHIGVHTWRTRGQGGFVPDPDAPDPHAAWVVPVVDPGADLESPVRMWVTPGYPVGGATNPETWFAELRQSFDGKSIIAKVRGRAGEGRGSAWEKAVLDVEARHGLASHPQAPIVIWPSKS